jgi:SAM-dependent methyltransferase
MKNASDNHNNKKPWNWLVYKCNDQFLNKYSHLYKGTMYDLGCGARTYEPYFLQYVPTYIGVDWGASVHDLKAEIVADLNKPLPINNNSADTIVCLSVLEHLCEPQTLVNEAYRILKPGGAIILQVPWQWWIHEAPYDFFRYTPYALKYMFEKAGFTNVEVEPTTGFFSMWFIKMNYFSLRFIKGPKIFRGIKKAIFLPFWYLGQKIAPTLDRKLDNNWAAEAQGYYVVAKKN